MAEISREAAHLVRDILALPERERIEIFARLREDLGSAVGPSESDKINDRRENAIDILLNVAEYLTLDSEVAFWRCG